MIPCRFPSVVSDRMLAAWQDIHWGEMLIHMDCEFEHPLDEDRLARACDLALDAEPVLGCRFVTDRGTPFWERLPDAGRPALELTRDPRRAEEFLQEVPDFRLGPQLRVLLVRQPAGDRVVFKVSHVVADAGGTRHAVAVVSDLYRRLRREPGLVPEPNVRGSRSTMQVFRRVPWHAHPRILLNLLAASIRNRRSVHRILPPDVPRLPFGWALRTLDARRTAALAGFGRERGATLNDLLVAAFLRAIAASTGDAPPRSRHCLQITVDLRRYVPGERAGGICNLSAFDYVDLGTAPGQDFPETLSRVLAATTARKRSWPGLLEIATGPFLRVLPHPWLIRMFRYLLDQRFRRWGGSNALTNMGPIAASVVDFDQAPRTAHLLTPVIYPPMLGAGVSGYAGALTLSVGVPSAGLAGVETFLDRVLAELPDAAG